MASRRCAQIASQRHDDQQHVERDVGESGETNFEPGESVRQRRRGDPPAPRRAEHHQRQNGQPNRLAHQHEELALRRVARRPGDGPAKPHHGERERRDEPLHGLRDPVVARRSPRRDGGGCSRGPLPREVTPPARVLTAQSRGIREPPSRRPAGEECRRDATPSRPRPGCLTASDR